MFGLYATMTTGAATPAPGTELSERALTLPTSQLTVYWHPTVSTTPACNNSGGGTSQLIVLEANSAAPPSPKPKSQALG